MKKSAAAGRKSVPKTSQGAETKKRGRKRRKSSDDVAGASKVLCDSDRRPQPPPKAAEASPATADKPTVETKQMKAKMKLLETATSGLLTNIGPSWFKALESEFSKDYMKELGKFVAAQRKQFTVHPTHENVFSWTHLCPLEGVKVVILGQDPYFRPNQAHGLSFSVLRPTTPGVKVKLPPSLLNIYKELEEELPGVFKRPAHGDLTGWAQQGVLMLNAVLTVNDGSPNSHKGQGWEKLTDAAVNVLNEQGKGLVFILWGEYARKKGSKIDKTKHKVLEGAHPSPMAKGFQGCGHFVAANEYLKTQGQTPIDWSHLP